MSSGNPRGKPRRNGSIPDYGGQHMVNAQMQGVMPPPPPQTLQSLANGSAGGGPVQPQQQSLSFAMPNVDTNQLNHYRSLPRNPTLQLAAADILREPPQQGTQHFTLHARFQQPIAPQQNYSSTPQVNPFSMAPPSNMYSYVYNPQAVSQTLQAPVLHQMVPDVYPYYTQTQQPTFVTPARMGFGQSGIMMARNNPPVPTSTGSTYVAPKQKKILSIVNPETNEVTNREDIMKQLQENFNSDEGSRKCSPAVVEPMREHVSMPSNASQKFTMQVAQSVLGDSTSLAIKTAASAASRQPLPLIESENVALRPSTSAPPTDITTSSLASNDHLEKSAPPDVSSTTKKLAEMDLSQSSYGDTIAVDETVAEVADVAIEVESATAANTTKDVKKHVEVSKKADVDLVKTGECETATSTMLSVAGAVSKSKAEEHFSVEESLSIPLAHSVAEIVHEVSEREEVVEQESDEAVLEKKEKDFIQKQQVLLSNQNIVRTAEKFYGREYLLLIKDIVKELKRDVDVCPVGVPYLKELGIDIASAPAVGLSGDRQRRYDGIGGASKFLPGWVPDRNQSKPKAYHGRLSDRTHSNQRNDRDRKRSTVARPSIDRPNREPVKLHKAEHAWKPEKNIDVNQKLYKEVRGLLNKITPSTFGDLLVEFLGYEVYKNDEQMEEVINVIFDKAVEEPAFCSLYSDLCKRQVIEESRESKEKSKFRNALLTRCQQTFETKRLDEIRKKKEELESESDDKRMRELKVEIMEMEAKERRRMFGNIAFIGQLYRHELIVPRILNWCIVHLLKSHSETAGGDEESIECAVKMLESVGKIAEKQMTIAIAGSQDAKPEFNIKIYVDHLNGLAGNVSNRIRFLIINLIELRDNGWNPRKLAEVGPKTIEQVHDEVRKEEIQNKIQREQYGKKRYEGRNSLDKRNQRNLVIGRQSQDGRSYNKGVEQSRDQKARAAGAAGLVANTASRKNQSLNSMDQPQSLGARRPPFSGGAIGGGQQSDRSLQSRSVIGMRGAGRGSFASRENSQPSSREASESRKQTRDDVRTSIVAEGVVGLEGGNAVLKRGYAGAAAGGSSASLSVGDNEKKERCQVELRNDVDSGQSKRFPDEKEMIGTLHGSLHEYFQDQSNIEMVYGSFVECVFDAKSNSIDTKAVQLALRCIMKVGIEKLRGDVRSDQRRYIGQVMCRCLQHAEVKEDGLQGVADFCTYAVTSELWEDNMRLWEAVAEIISWSIMCDTQHFDGARPSLGDFREAFKNADADTRKPNALLVNILKRLVEIERERDGHVSSTGMAFEEIRDLHTPSLISELKSCQLASGENLYQLLLN